MHICLFGYERRAQHMPRGFTRINYGLTHSPQLTFSDPWVGPPPCTYEVVGSTPASATSVTGSSSAVE